MAEQAESAGHLAAAWGHLAAAAHYLGRATWASPLAAGAPSCRPPLPLPHHRRHDLEVGFDVDYGAGAHSDHRRHHVSPPRHRHGEHDDDGGSDSTADADADLEDGSRGGDIAAADSGGEDAEAEDDDDFEFALQDLYDLLYVVGVCVPPYPTYRASASYRHAHGESWIWVVFCYSLLFASLITLFSVRVFRSSRRFLPTALRSIVLALSLAAQASTFSHVLPSSTLSTIVSYVSILFHLSVYLAAWCLCCSALCRRAVGLGCGCV